MDNLFEAIGNGDSYMDFQFEQERIVSAKTKEYVKEAINCYNDHNYRSAVNSLYSVMIVDLIEKITVLSSLYDDEKAKQIIDATNENIEYNIKHDKWIPWEGKLIESLHKTPILSSETLYQTITELKKWRNFSSHPSLNDFGANLETPDRYVVAHFFHILFNQLFTVSPSLIGNITSKFLDFLAEKQSLLIENEEKMDIYIKDSFLNKMYDDQKDELVKSMFKFVFISKTDNFEKYRDINFRALCAILRTNPTRYTDLLISDTVLIHKVELTDIDERVNYFEKFIGKHNRLYQALSETQKSIIENNFQKNLGKYLLYPFVINSENYKDRVDEIQKIIKIEGSMRTDLNKLSIDGAIDPADMLDLIECFKLKDELPILHELIISIFSGSESYAQAKDLYLKNIILITNDLNDDNWKYLLEIVNENDQIHNSFGVDTSNMIKLYADYLQKNDPTSTKDLNEIVHDLKKKYNKILI